MPIYLKQSTASQEISLGYFVDSGDGNTEETGLTIANTDIKLHKTGGTTAGNKNSGGATHIANGIYYAVLDATDTGTLGSLTIFCHVAGALAVRLECVVLAANIYDAMIGGGDLIDVSATQILGTAISTPATAGILDVNLKNIANAAVSATTAQLGVNVVNAAGTAWGSGAITAESIASNAIAAAKIATGAITSAKFAAGAIDAAAIADNAIDAGAIANGSLTDVKFADNFLTAAKIATDAIDADAIKADAITEIQSGLATSAALATVQADTDNIQTRLPAALVGGKMDSTATVTGTVDANIVSIATDAITAASIKDDAVSEIADGIWDEALSGHSTAGTAGKKLTDIPTSVSGTVDANLVSIDGELTSGNNATLKLKQLDVTNSSGHAAIFQGGGTGTGITAQGGLTSGNALRLMASADQAIVIQAGSGQDAVIISAGGSGIQVTPGGNGDAVRLNTSGTGKAINAAEINAILVDTGTDIPASIAALPTDADVNAACDTAISDAALATAANLSAAKTVIDAIVIDTGTDIPASIAALPTDADVQTAAAAALTAYDPPTNTELTAATAGVTNNVKDILLNKEVITRHANEKPSQYTSGTLTNQETVNTTIDLNGNIETESQV